MAEGVFGDGNNAVVIEGLPIKAGISKPGGQDMNKLSLSVRGLKLETMERLTVLGFKPHKTYNNIVIVEAGNKGQKLDTAFSGEVTTAVPVFEDSGAVSFKIEAQTGAYPNKIASSPVSVKGTVPVAELMRQFAEEAGYTFQNEGVDSSVKNSIFRGSPVLKAKALAQQVGIDLLVDDRKFVILPKNKHIKGEIPLLSKNSGLLGYPSFTNDGIDAKCIYDSRLNLGSLVELKSIVPKASGMWRISKLEHNLEANQTGSGNWLTTFSAVWVG